MSVFAVKLGGLLSSVVVMAGGSWWIYDQSLPKDLKSFFLSQGRLIATEKEAFKVILEENKDEVKPFNINRPEGEVEELEDWCKKSLELNPYKVDQGTKDKIVKFCLDDPKTVKGFVIRKGKELIIETEDYKTVFALYKDNSDFVSWIGKSMNSMNLENGYSELRDKCNLELSKKLSDLSAKDLGGTFWWCAVSEVKVIGDLLKKEDLSILSNFDDSGSEWEQKFEIWKNTESVVESIKKYDSSFSKDEDKSASGPKIRKWCEASSSKKFSEEGVYPVLYSQVKGVCTNYQPKK